MHIPARQPESCGVTVAAARGRGVISGNFAAHRVLAGHRRSMAKGLAEAGPFGHMLLPGLDWSGVNAAWQAETMGRLAEEVRPKLRQHAATLSAA